MWINHRHIGLAALIITLLIVGCAQDNESPSASPATVTTSPLPGTSTPTPLLVDEIEPLIDLQPASALADAPITIQVRHLEPGQIVTLTASMRDDFDRRWESFGRFAANSAGVVDLGSQAPLTGTYHLADPMGLVWSMRPQSSGEANPFFVNYDTTSMIMTVEGEVEGKRLEPAFTERIRLSETVQQETISENGLIGMLYLPAGAGPHPGLLVLSGSGGDTDIIKARTLAAHGYAALALDYFGNPPLPPDLTEIPLEYFQNAITWLQAQESVAENKIGVVGTSRGGELALLLGANYPDIKVVIGYVASGVVIGNLGADSLGETAAWTIGGEPVPFSRSEADYEQAIIPVENINGPVLLISGADDQVWPSTFLSGIAIDRLAQTNHPFPYEHLIYTDAGHLIDAPYWPTTGNEAAHPVIGQNISFGGTPAGNAHASADSWPRVLAFLENAFLPIEE